MIFTLSMDYYLNAIPSTCIELLQMELATSFL